MTLLNIRAIALALAGLALAAPAALAQSAPLSATIQTCDSPPAATEQSDQAIVDAAQDAITRGGYPALARHLQALAGVMERAPACYPFVERRGTAAVIRTHDPSEFMIVATLIASEERQTSTTMVANIYPMASLLLASYAVEARRFDEGLAWLERGLALQPDNQYLILEKVAALLGLRDFEAARALLQAGLDNPRLSLTLDRPRFLTSLGVALIDLDRLDEAEVALQEAIRLEPGRTGAENELEYIAQLRRGGAQRELELTSSASPRK